MKIMIAALAMLAGSGCTALQTRAEQAWLTLHLIDSTQTYRIAQHPECYHEGDPLTSELIGAYPSRRSVVAWSIGTAALHAGVTSWLIEHEHPQAARWWQYLTIANSASAVGNNVSIGIRIGAHNDRPDCR